MNQKFIIIDDFYNAACMTGKDIHLDFLESEYKNEVVGEVTEKVSSILHQILIMIGLQSYILIFLQRHIILVGD